MAEVSSTHNMPRPAAGRTVTSLLWMVDGSIACVFGRDACAIETIVPVHTLHRPGHVLHFEDLRPVAVPSTDSIKT